MLKIITKARDLDISQLKDVYAGSIGYDALQPGDSSENVRMLRALERFYSYAYDFLQDQNAFYGIWMKNDVYVSAVRVDKYLDGFLLSGLETAPKLRGCGYARQLVDAVAQHLEQQGTTKLYSHVAEDNLPSLAVHRACSFEKIKDGAVFLDGSASSEYVTLCRTKDACT